MKATFLLANSAQIYEGLVSALGIGWSQSYSPTMPYALVLIIQVPWDRTDHQHNLKVKLVDSDGRNPADSHGKRRVVEVRAQFAVGRPAGLPAGSDVETSETIQIAPMDLAPGQYEWRVEINDEALASRSFFVLPS